MPVVKPSFQSESRLEISPSSSYHALVANLYLGFLALTAVAGARYISKVLCLRRTKNQTADCYCYCTTKASARDFIRVTDEESRGVSIVNGSKMSTNQPVPTPFSIQGLDVEGSANRKNSGEMADIATAAETPEGLVAESLVPLAIGQKPLLPLLSRPPLPPTSTLPDLSPTTFTFDKRRRSFPPPELPVLNTETFIHQPNPDYFGESSSISVAGATPFSEAPEPATTPKRRSYSKAVSFPALSSGIESESEFFPSSFPSASPHLPPPAEFPETSNSQQEIDVHGEIISSFDDAGHGWTRHTRVYGGGVCLACLQSGGEGGFYGENVRPEDRQ